MDRLYKPGTFELYYGPMKSGKTKVLMDKAEKLSYANNIPYVIIRPSIDTRDGDLTSRSSDKAIPSIYIPEDKPYDILRHAGSNIKVVLIDELQFFGEGIEKVVEALQKEDFHVIGAGLNLNYGGEPIGRMPYLLSLATEPHALTAVCDYPKCDALATRTQLLKNGEPAEYTKGLDIIVDGIQDSLEYQARCLHHLNVAIKDDKESKFVLP